MDYYVSRNVQTHVQSTVRASEHCVIRSSPCNASKHLATSITRLFTPEYLCKPGKKAACLREGDYEAGHAITHVQTHVQSTVQP